MHAHGDVNQRGGLLRRLDRAAKITIDHQHQDLLCPALLRGAVGLGVIADAGLRGGRQLFFGLQTTVKHLRLQRFPVAVEDAVPDQHVRLDGDLPAFHQRLRDVADGVGEDFDFGIRHR